MELILNPAYPHISEKIFKCLGISVHRSLNREIKKNTENIFFDEIKKQFLKKIKYLTTPEASEYNHIEVNCVGHQESDFGPRWLTWVKLFEILDNFELWKSDIIKENLLLCMIRILNLIKSDQGI